MTLNSPSSCVKTPMGAMVNGAKAFSSHIFHYWPNICRTIQSYGLFVVLWTYYSISYLKIFIDVIFLSRVFILLLIFLRTWRHCFSGKISHAHRAHSFCAHSIWSFAVNSELTVLYCCFLYCTHLSLTGLQAPQGKIHVSELFFLDFIRTIISSRNIYFFFKHSVSIFRPRWDYPHKKEEKEGKGEKNCFSPFGCYNEITQNGQIIKRKFISHRFGGWEVQDQITCMVTLLWGLSSSWFIDITFSLCSHTLEGVRELCGVFFITALTPFLRALPLRPYHLPKLLLPNTITLATRISTTEFWRYINIQITARI